MLLSRLALVVIGLMSQGVLSSSDPCATRPPVVEPCRDLQPRDLLFVIDASNTMDRQIFYTLMMDFAQTLYCAFEQNIPNRAGMILFGQHIDLKIPLDFYSTRQWFSEVEKIRADETSCCTCCVRLNFATYIS